MGTASATLVDALRQYRLLDAQQLTQLNQTQTGSDPKALAKELLRRGWLTPYQVNQLLQARGQDLLLGSYILLERLGEGGMGQVFKARNWKLGQVVALKLIRPERIARPDAVRRFHREIQVAAHLNHPNIVRALDADEVSGTHLLVMEYVEGIDLSRLVKQSGPLPVRKACDYIRQSALGLQHAFEQGLVHRDIKPSNLLLTTKDGVVKILDLGLARLEDAAESETATCMTQTDVVVGTPDFIAPEQARNSHSADVRADLYGLGGSLYYLLTGQVPFPGVSATEKLLQHLLEEPRPIEQLRPDVPAEIVAVVRKLMAKRPEDRYQTPAETARVFDSLLSSTSIAAPTAMKASNPTVLRMLAAQKASLPTRLAPSVRARRYWPRVAVVAFVLLLGASAISWKLLGRPNSPVAISPVPNATATEAKEPSPRPSAIGKSRPPEEPPDSSVKEAIAVLGGPSFGAVYAVAVCPDGNSNIMASSSSADNDIHLWDTKNWRPRTEVLRGHIGDIRALAYAPNGKTLASGSSDKTVKLWDMASGNEIASFPGHTGVVRSVAFSADGRTLASGAEGDPLVRLWDVQGKHGKSSWKVNDRGVNVVAFAPDGLTLATAGGDNFVRLWELGTEKEPIPLKGQNLSIISLAYGPSGSGRLAMGSAGQHMWLWNLTAQKNNDLRGHNGGTAGLAFSPDGKKLASAGGSKNDPNKEKGLLNLWDVEAEQLLHQWRFSSRVHCVAFGPNGQYLAVGTGAGTIQIFPADGRWKANK